MKKQMMLIGVVLVVGCSTSSKNKSEPHGTPGGHTVIRYDYKAGEITEICKNAMKKSDERIAKLLEQPDKDRNFENTIVAFEEIGADLSDEVTPAIFMNAVSQNAAIRSESEKCETELGQYSVGLATRRDIFNALKAAEKNSKKQKLSAVDKVLIEKTLREFRRNGLDLDDKQLDQVRELKKRLTAIETKFATNLNENVDFVEMTPAEMAGVPPEALKRFTVLPNGNYKVSTKINEYVQFMQNATSAEARKKLAIKYENRCAEENTKLFEEALEIRQKLAKLLKFKNWADYKIANKMAKKASTAQTFLDGLKAKIAARNKKDLSDMLKLKKELEPSAKELFAWDTRYYDYQLKKRLYDLDDEMIREYFPADHVVGEMFKIYSTLLGVKYVEVAGADVWAPGVKLFEIRDAKDNHFIAHFFADFYPREGKYGHAAAFTLRPGRMVNGTYRTPIASIVSNFNPPTKDKPSLLSHDEVETLFHEFGHIMHQTLTTAPYASLSGTSVAWDFVEAPSQMLENWVWDKGMLKQISGHYKDLSKKLPDDVIDRLLKSRNFNLGYFYTRQLLFGLFDMKLHTSTKPIDPTKTYLKLFGEVTGIKPMSESHFPASFGHLMGGYDAGYYGYLWSEVFAQDMFSQFKSKGLLSEKLGRKYRDTILAQGDTQDADKLLKAFLGRNPNNKAFLSRLSGKQQDR